jgi:hypothetical protein
MRGEFSVVQFFAEPVGTFEYVRRFVTSEEAVEAFIRYTNNVATSLGMVERVIITDGGDSTNMEWIRGKGITYPPEAVGKVLRKDWKERLRGR